MISVLRAQASATIQRYLVKCLELGGFEVPVQIELYRSALAVTEILLHVSLVWRLFLPAGYRSKNLDTTIRGAF
mgnify:CR=1 FL=1